MYGERGHIGIRDNGVRCEDFRDVKAALKAERTLLDREDGLTAGLLRLADEGSLALVRKQAAQLRAQAEAAADSPGRQSARRVIAGLAGGGREIVRTLFQEREYAAAAARLELIAAVRPDRSQTYFDLARAYAFDGDKKRALAALQQATALGFKDIARLTTEPAFERLRQDPGFEQLAAGMKP